MTQRYLPPPATGPGPALSQGDPAAAAVAAAQTGRSSLGALQGTLGISGITLGNTDYLIHHFREEWSDTIIGNSDHLMHHFMEQ